MIKELLIQHILRGREKHGWQKPKIGHYFPSILGWSCPAAQYQYYKLAERSDEKLEDEIVLLLARGEAEHRWLQSLKDPKKNRRYWDQIEVPCSYRFKVGEDTVTISGRADAVKNKEVYEFKTTQYIPKKPRFNNLLQLQFYLGAMERGRGWLLYLGYGDTGGLELREFPVQFSEWHFLLMLERASSLHLFLKAGVQPHCTCRTKRHDAITIDNE